MPKETINIIPNPDKVLIRINKADWNSLFSKYVKGADGKLTEIFIDIEEASGFDRRFQQNVSIGTVIAVGKFVRGVQKGDMAIIDYLVTVSDDYVVGFVNGERIVAINGHTTYEEADAPPSLTGLSAYVKGDYDHISLLYGVVRDKEIISRSPYVFLIHQNPLKVLVSESGNTYEEMEQLCTRTVMANNEGTYCKQGDKVAIKASDISERIINNKTLSVAFQEDILAVL